MPLAVCTVIRYAATSTLRTLRDVDILLLLLVGGTLGRMADPPKLLDRVRTAIRARHYSRRTEDAYATWIRRYILFHGKRHPSAMGADEVNAFLSFLATERNVSASTQNQALSALIFLYREILKDPLPWLNDVVRAQRPERLPVVLTVDEVHRVIDGMNGVSRLVAQLLYGGGLRLLEAMMLRVKDVDFERGQITIRDPKWKRDRAPCSRRR